MKQQYEIRSADHKRVYRKIDDRHYSSIVTTYRDHIAWLRNQGKDDTDVLVLHEFETDAEADAARLDWLEANGHAVTSIEHGSGLSFYVAPIGKFNSVREAIDAARNAPKPSVKVIATPEGEAK